MDPTRLERALSVLRYLARHPEGQNLSHLASDLDIPVSSAHDLLQALVEIDAVRSARPRTYTLGRRSVSLGLAVAESVELRRVARQPLRELADDIDETVCLAIRSGDDVVYADRYETVRKPTSVLIALGENRPLHSSSAGKLITAYDPALEARVLSSPYFEPYTRYTLVEHDDLRAEYARIRRQHYSVNDGEAVEGIRGFSTPIVDSSGHVVAAAQIVAPRTRLDDDHLKTVMVRMSDAAAIMSARLGAAASAIPGSIAERGRPDEPSGPRVRSTTGWADPASRGDSPGRQPALAFSGARNWTREPRKN